MDLYNTLMSGYIFDNNSGQFYRRTKEQNPYFYDPQEPVTKYQ